ncbi:hypothetical protein [Flavobacterium sp. SLB02]|uniref:hypothetical protein n=1 Tax=Flavobacterium sp. SLB02 TaxID=2665645 RepID=UPI0012A9DA0F|nr:hypothetical protein [Flavobacterium sp. SLB02]QGK73919.1 hypothetical protein GIY83_07560 [Flavobacterium sp. SLB02]
MIAKFLSLLLLILSFQAKSQNADESIKIEDNSISAQLYTKCFENLNQGSKVLEKYTAFKNVKLCSLAYCMMLLAYQDKEIQQMGKNRLIGIATQLYHEKTPVILIMGMDSSIEAQKRNQNLDDDDHIVYISYGECTNPVFLSKAAEIVNKQTRTLVYQNR